MRLLTRIIAGVALAATVSWVASPVVLACSPPFEKPSIRGLGPAPIVFLGTTGERVAGGRLFHIERAWNSQTTTPIVISFREGEPIGDCSYPVMAGEHLIIAPDLVNGVLAANLVTLQADPASDVGRVYLADTELLYGAGLIPVEEALAPAPADQAAGQGANGPGTASADARWVILGLGAGLAFLGLVLVVARHPFWLRGRG